MVGKKMEDLGLMALFFCPPFFCHFKCTTDISVDVNMPFNVNAFQGDQNVVEYWIPDARTSPIRARTNHVSTFETLQVGLRCMGLLPLA